MVMAILESVGRAEWSVRGTACFVPLALALAALPAAPLLAHGATGGDLPLVPAVVPLKHQRAAGIVALFARERPPAPNEVLPRAARSGAAEALLPSGIEAVMRAAGAGRDEVVLVGSAGGFAALAGCVEVLDVPVTRIAAEREKIVLTLREGDPRRVRGSVLRLPDAGSAAVMGGRLVLEGSPGWLHHALRQVIRAELKLTEQDPGLTP